METKEYEIYARVSTEDQNVEQQADKVKEWSLNRYNCIWTVRDTESGTLPLTERKYFLNQLNRIKEKKRGLLIYNLDRLTRNWDDVTFIEKFFRDNWQECPLVSMSDSIDLSNASGRMMFRIKMSIGCYMPEDMREKQKIGIDRARAEGKYKGSKKGRKWSKSTTP